MGFANVARFFLCGLNFSLEDFFFYKFPQRLNWISLVAFTETLSQQQR